MPSNRYIEVDLVRGFALLLMVAFHFSYDLNHFGYINIEIRHGLDWRYFRYFILTLFIMTVGISLVLANATKINYQKVSQRALKLLVASSIITVASYFMNPSMWIYFGVIHFILVGSLVGLLFVKKPYLSLAVGVVIIILYNLGFANMHWLHNVLQEPLHLPRHTEDLVQFVPWFGVLLIGIFIGEKKWYALGLKSNPFFEGLAFLGQHALIIYLVHQPILFGIFELIKMAKA